MTTQTKKAIVVGSTGGVGRWIVYTLALDPRVGMITAIVRGNSRPAEFFHLNPQQFQKVRQVDANFEKLDEKVFQGHDVGFSALGIYTSQAKDEAHFRRIEIDYNVAAAKAMMSGGVKRFAYLSGSGASQTGSMMMFARVKGDAEKALQNIGFERATVVRPGMILGRGTDAQLPPFYVQLDFLSNLVPQKFKIQAQEIARAMVHSTLGLPDAPVEPSRKWIWENMDIHRYAGEYEASMPK